MQVLHPHRKPLPKKKALQKRELQTTDFQLWTLWTALMIYQCLSLLPLMKVQQTPLLILFLTLDRTQGSTQFRMGDLMFLQSLPLRVLQMHPQNLLQKHLPLNLQWNSSLIRTTWTHRLQSRARLLTLQWMFRQKNMIYLQWTA